MALLVVDQRLTGSTSSKISEVLVDSTPGML
jgi:hypothetical protein